MLPGLTLTGLAFGFVEGAVVVYLRALSCPEGFRFPLTPLPRHLLLIEVAREAATLLLLLGVAWATERRGYRRFAVFAYCFGVWDLAYYGTLKALLDWPTGWLDWDVLFLIPLPWLGPVLAPILVSLALIGASLLLIRGAADRPSPFRPLDWAVLVASGVVVILSFLWNWRVAEGGIPERFPWWLFAIGYGGGLARFAWCWIRRETAGSARASS